MPKKSVKLRKVSTRVSRFNLLKEEQLVYDQMVKTLAQFEQGVSMELVESLVKDATELRHKLEEKKNLQKL